MPPLSLFNSRTEQKYMICLANITPKKAILGLIGLVILLVIVRAAFVFATMDTYTASVIKAPYDKEGVLYFTVRPDAKVGLNTEKGVYKLQITDSHVPFIAWATRSERFDALVPGDVICVSDIGMRNSWFSWFPNGLDYTEGACPPQS